MPKSTHRKNHKKRLISYKNKIQHKRNQIRKEYIDMMKAKQQESVDKAVMESQVADVVDAENLDLGIEDVKIEE